MILFENENYLVVDKRPGYLSVPGRFADDARPSELKEWSLAKGRLWVCHRLDEEVSGLLLFAKTPEGHRLANQWFEARQVHKTYEALTEGAPEAPQEFLWKSRLLRGKKRAFERDYGKPSETQAKFLETVDGHGLWRIHPLTGRSHQIRFELFKHQYPAWGDELYGAKEKFPVAGAIGLRAVELDFSQCDRLPSTGLPLTLKAVGIREWMASQK